MATVASHTTVQATCGCVGKSTVALAATVSKGASAFIVLIVVVVAVVVVVAGVVVVVVVVAAVVAVVVILGAIHPIAAAMPARPGNACRWHNQAWCTSNGACIGQLSLASIAEAR